MSNMEKYQTRILAQYPNYHFSWEILTRIILENAASQPYWLDLGAGPNILIREQPGAKFAVGVDIEKPGSIELSPDEAYCVAAGELLPFKANCINFITSRYTFEHLAHPRDVLHEIERVLQPGGCVVIQTTNKLNPLIVLSRLIPFGIKKRLIKSLFKDNPSGTFRTYDRMNKPSAVKPQIGSLVLQELILVDDILCQNRLLFTISYAIFRMQKALGLEGLANNIIAVYRKNTS